jgi:sodium/bile acid cotransporter 7
MINIKKLYAYIPETNKCLIKNLNIQIKQGEFVILLGSNGSGKSSLLSLINKTSSLKYKGKIMINGCKIQQKTINLLVATVTQSISENLFLNLTILENFLIFLLTLATLISLTEPTPGRFLASLYINELEIIPYLCIVAVFLISGIILRIEDLKTIWDKKCIVFYGIMTINIITTFVALIARILPFNTKAFATGLTIFLSVPTTLGVGVTLTQYSKGDVLLSLLLPVISNMLGVLTAPLLLQVYLKSTSVSIDASALAYNMTLSVLIPTVVGICLRKYFSCIPKFTKERKQELSMLSSFALILIVFMTLSVSREIILAQNVIEIIILFITVSVIYLFYLIFNYLVLKYFLSYFISLKLEQIISIVIMGSQV